jgi:hypothetical protein
LILDDLAIYFAQFVSGKFPQTLAQYYASARLIPLIKKNGGIRPLAVGDTLRRLACKLALTLIKVDIPAVFHPHQYGVGLPNGAETIIHSVASAMENLADDENILQIDFSNAFNLVSRDEFINLINVHFPALSNLVNFLYTTQALLTVGYNDHILSCSGVQQGCPLAPLLFALVLRKLTMLVDIPNITLHQWYLDDGHFVGKSHDLLTILSNIRTIGSELGLILNLSKCVVFGKNSASFPPEIARASEGILVLGSPIGSDDFISSHVNEQVFKASNTLFLSRELKDPQMELLLLRCCSGAPKMTYWLRTCNPRVIRKELADFDSSVNISLLHILGTPVNHEDRLLMHLPLSFGGLGIPISSLSAESSFVASVGSTWSKQQAHTIRLGFFEASQTLIHKNILLPPLPPKSLQSVSPLTTSKSEFAQKGFMITINTEIRNTLFLSFDLRRQTVVTARACKGASYWLTSPPNISANSVIDNASFRLLLKYSLGIPILSRTCRCPDCGKNQDIYGDHATSCKNAAGVIDKHNSIVNSIFLTMKQANISCSSESFNPQNPTRQRPGDIFMADFDYFGDAYFDVSVINITSHAYLPRSSKGQLEGSKIRFEEKLRKYPDLGPRLKPLILECFGGWHCFSFDYLRTIANHISARSNRNVVDILNLILKRTSFCLQRHQGSMLVRRCLGL